MLHQVGDLFELNVKLRCQKVKYSKSTFSQNATNLLSIINVATYFDLYGHHQANY
jgi:hypothetical protein